MQFYPEPANIFGLFIFLASHFRVPLKLLHIWVQTENPTLESCNGIMTHKHINLFSFHRCYYI